MVVVKVDTAGRIAAAWALSTTKLPTGGAMTFAKSFKTEVARIAAREVKSALEGTRRQVVAHRRHIAALRRQLSDMESAVTQLQRVVKRNVTNAGKAVEADA